VAGFEIDLLQCRRTKKISEWYTDRNIDDIMALALMRKISLPAQ